MSASWLSLVHCCVSRGITERRQRCFRRLTFTIVSFGPLFHRNDQGAPLSRRPRDCAVKNVISEWCFHRILLRLTCSPSFIASRNNDRFVFAKEEKLRRRCYRCSSWIYRRRGPSMEIARESKYLCPGYMHISYHVDFSFESRVRVLEHLARSWNVATVV